jgi:hypothetical protein
MSENESVVQGMLESANRQDAAAIHSYLAEAMHAVNPKLGASCCKQNACGPVRASGGIP